MSVKGNYKISVSVKKSRKLFNPSIERKKIAMSFFDKWRQRGSNSGGNASEVKPLSSVLRRENISAASGISDQSSPNAVNHRGVDHNTVNNAAANYNSVNHKFNNSLQRKTIDNPELPTTKSSITRSSKMADSTANANDQAKFAHNSKTANSKMTESRKLTPRSDDELTIPAFPPHWHSFPPERLVESDELLDRHKLFNVEDEVLELVDPKFAKEQEILPIELAGNLLTVVCAQRQSRRVAEHVLQSQHPQLVFRFLYSTAEMIQAAIDHHYLRRDLKINESQRAARYRQISTQIRQVNTSRRLNKHLIFSTNGQFSNSDTAIRELLENLLCDGHWARATDIDIDLFRRDRQNWQPGQPREFMVCRIRVDGEYQVIHEEPMELEKYDRIPHVLKIYAGLDPNNTWDGQSGVVRPTLAYATRESAVEFRVNFIPAGEERGESISVRVQERDNFTFSLHKIGLLPSQDTMVRQEIMQLTQGMVIFAGPINKGKNTSMVCLIKEFQTQFPAKKIITVEDPPEFNLPYVTQIAVGQQREENLLGNEKRAFKYYLKHILRHNPDIIVVGEVREPEPAQMAIETASIGHLVLTTMHTANAIEAIDRLRNFGIENYKIAGGVKTIIAQRLVKQICEACVKVPDRDIAQLKIDRLTEYIAQLGWPTDTVFVKGSGRNSVGEECFQCRGKGFYNRLGIFELLTISREIRNLIGRGATPDEIRQQAFQEGFRSLWINGLERALEGRTTLGEVLYQVGRPDAFVEGLPSLPANELVKIKHSVEINAAIVDEAVNDVNEKFDIKQVIDTKAAVEINNMVSEARVMSNDVEALTY
jgi:type II secretory ATPase GspE/PulE/Tfp pilus assembly ATPase PilB-like protein